MTNLEIDRKLAEAMGYKELVENEGYLWEPSIDMSDAWEVAEHFKILGINRTVDWKWMASAIIDTPKVYQHIKETNESAPLAICKAALKVIEGSKSDELTIYIENKSWHKHSQPFERSSEKQNGQIKRST
jgi:hypothetical protein